jgi:hypothetical protein
MISKVFFTATVLALLASAAPAQQDVKPSASEHQAMAHCDMAQMHGDAVKTRGEHAMGFSQDGTTHHFRLTPQGGSIAVEVKDPQDSANRDKIQAHLEHIARAFADGDLEMPMFIHDQVPPGVPAMKRLKKSITYEMAKTDRGAEVRIASQNAEAINAIHEFLRFQIEDHHTGDSTEVTP